MTVVNRQVQRPGLRARASGWLHDTPSQLSGTRTWMPARPVGEDSVFGQVRVSTPCHADDKMPSNCALFINGTHVLVEILLCADCQQRLFHLPPHVVSASDLPAAVSSRTVSPVLRALRRGDPAARARVRSRNAAGPGIAVGCAEAVRFQPHGTAAPIALRQGARRMLARRARSDHREP